MRLLLYIFFLNSIVFLAKSENFVASKGGFQIGGAIPITSLEGSYAKPGISTHIGIEFFQKKTERIKLKSGINLHYRKLSYGQEVRKDTLITIEIQGQQGTVPSYYYANTNGDMSFLSLELPFNIFYQIKNRLSVQLGFWGQYHLYKQDSGSTHIQIGEGGVLDDVEEDFDNHDDLRKADLGLSTGINFRLSPKFDLELEIQRGFFSIYKKDFSLPTEPQNLFKAYNTYVLLSLRYKFFRY